MQQLVKAQLLALDGGENIDFMFNPTELAFNRALNLNYDSGARTEYGLPKVSFAYPQPYSLQITNILFDTRESRTNVLLHIDKLKKAVEFSEFRESENSSGNRPRARSSGNRSQEDNKRPPTYMFCWGEKYLRCFVKSLSYKLTLFLPNGMPIRAVVDLELEEVDNPITEPHLTAPAARDRNDSPQSRKNPPKAVQPTRPNPS
jgi:hypothetical protein